MPRPVPAIGRWFPLHCGALLLLTPCLSVLGQTPPEHYQLFVGRDLSVKLDDTFLPVRNVVSDQLEIGTPEAIQHLPLDPLPPVLVRDSVKLSADLVTIADLEHRRVISPSSQTAVERDAQYARVLQHMERELAEGEKYRGEFGPRELLPGENPSIKQQTSDLAYETALDQIDQHVNRTFLNDRDYADGAPFDALQVSAEISAPSPLAQAYAVWVCTFTAPQAGFERRHQNVYLRPLPTLSPTPHGVSTRLDGFPEGFTLQELSVAIFVGPRELATNLSARRFELTPSQAHEYLITDYIARHRAQDVPTPFPVRELQHSLTFDPTTVNVLETMVLEISALGEVTNLRLPEAPAHTDLAPYIGAVQSLAFYPALRDGKPVNGEYIGSLRQLQ